MQEHHQQTWNVNGREARVRVVMAQGSEQFFAVRYTDLATALTGEASAEKVRYYMPNARRKAQRIGGDEASLLGDRGLLADALAALGEVRRLEFSLGFLADRSARRARSYRTGCT